MNFEIMIEQCPILTVEPGRTLQEQIECGNYDWCHADIREGRFPITDDQVDDWEWKPFSFTDPISCEKSIIAMNAEDFEAGKIGHLLAFGKRFPQEQRKRKIIAPGSIERILLGREVPGLYFKKEKRTLSLFSADSSFSETYFIGVRRHPKTSGA